MRDPQPSLTFVEETLHRPRRPGAACATAFSPPCELHEFDEGVVFPHEWTLSGPKEDRFRLMTATAMSLSPVFLALRPAGDDITAAWEAGLGAQAPAVDRGRLTTARSRSCGPPPTPPCSRSWGRTLAAARFVIADGHHRYETALRYQKHRQADIAGVGGPGDHESRDDVRPTTTSWPTSATWPIQGWPSTAPTAWSPVSTRRRWRRCRARWPDVRGGDAVVAPGGG